eukprot:6109133-Pleurochrysis_carterae.AAC.1
MRWKRAQRSKHNTRRTVAGMHATTRFRFLMSCHGGGACVRRERVHTIRQGHAQNGSGVT